MLYIMEGRWKLQWPVSPSVCFKGIALIIFFTCFFNNSVFSLHIKLQLALCQQCTKRDQPTRGRQKLKDQTSTIFKGYYIRVFSIGKYFKIKEFILIQQIRPHEDYRLVRNPPGDLRALKKNMHNPKSWLVFIAGRGDATPQTSMRGCFGYQRMDLGSVVQL